MPRDVDISVGADTSGFSTGMQALRAEVAGTATAIQRDFSAALSLGGIGVGLIGVQAVKELAEYGSRIQDLTERFEQNKEKQAEFATSLQQIGNVAAQNGSSLDTVAQALNRLDVARSKALSGNDQLLESFARLNVTEADLKNLSLDQILLKIGGSSFNAADAVKVLGRNGTELRSTLQGLAAGSLQLSSAIDSGTIAALDRADDKLKQVGQTFRVFFAEALAQAVRGAGNIGIVIEGLFANMAQNTRTAWNGFAGLVTGDMARFRKAMADAAGPSASSQLKKEWEDSWPSPGKTRKTTPGGAPASGGGGSNDFGDATNPADSGAEEKKQETLRANIAKLTADQLARQRSDQEQLNALTERSSQLYYAQAAAIGTGANKQEETNNILEARKAYLENEVEVQKLSAKMADEKAKAEERATAETQKAVEAADTETRASAEQAAELQQIAAGHGDIADRMKIEFDFAEKIKDAQQAASDARDQGDQSIAAANDALAVQLGVEREITLAARDRAAATKSLTNLTAEREITHEIQLQAAGKTEQAAQDKIRFAFATQISSALKDADAAEAEAKTAKTTEEKNALEAVAATNRALANQLAIERDVTLQVRAKEKAERDTAAAAKIALDTLIEALNQGTPQEQDRAAALSITLDYEEKITAAIREGNVETAKALTQQRDYNLQLAQGLKSAQDFNSTRSGISSQQQQQLANEGRSPQEIAALGGLGTGIASLGSSVTRTDYDLLRSLNPVTGAVDDLALRINRLRTVIPYNLSSASGTQQNEPGNIGFRDAAALSHQAQNLAAKQTQEIEQASRDYFAHLARLQQEELAALTRGGDLSKVLGTPEFAAAHPTTAATRLSSYLSGTELTDEQKKDFGIQDARDAARLAFEEKIKAAVTAATTARAAGNVVLAAQKDQLAAQLTDQQQLTLATFDASHATSAQAAARALLAERARVELDYQNRINAALTAGNNALAAQLEKQKAIALALLPTSAPGAPAETAEQKQARESVDDQIASSQERVRELQAQFAGNDKLAERLRIQFDYQKRIADATKAAAAARAAANEPLAAANDALAQQLGTEEQIALAKQAQTDAQKKTNTAQQQAIDYSARELQVLAGRLAAEEKAARAHKPPASASASASTAPPPVTTPHTPAVRPPAIPPPAIPALVPRAPTLFLAPSAPASAAAATLQLQHLSGLITQAITQLGAINKSNAAIAKNTHVRHG